MKNLKKNQGFTLIEILVVIGIIAILAAIVIIAINPARQFAQARNTQRTANVNAILNAIGQFTADNKGVLPDEIDDTAGSFQDISDVDGADANLCDGTDSELVPTYLPAMLYDPLADVDADCSNYDTGYTVDKDANERITVCAPNAADEDAIEDAEEICVTR